MVIFKILKIRRKFAEILISINAAIAVIVTKLKGTHVGGVTS